MESYSELFRQLSDETRLRIIHLLYYQDLCVCELVELLEESQPKISKHMAKLRSSNIVTSKRNEQFIYYSLNQSNTKQYQLIKTIIRDHLDVQYSKDKLALDQKTSFVCTRGEEQ